MAGDVELNPGPCGFKKVSTMSQCQQEIAIRSKTCSNCGLPQNSRKSIEAIMNFWLKEEKITRLLSCARCKRREKQKLASRTRYKMNP